MIIHQCRRNAEIKSHLIDPRIIASTCSPFPNSYWFSLLVGKFIFEKEQNVYLSNKKGYKESASCVTLLKDVLFMNSTLSLKYEPSPTDFILICIESFNGELLQNPPFMDITNEHISSKGCTWDSTFLFLFCIINHYL